MESTAAGGEQDELIDSLDPSDMYNSLSQVLIDGESKKKGLLRSVPVLAVGYGGVGRVMERWNSRWLQSAPKQKGGGTRNKEILLKAREYTRPLLCTADGWTDSPALLYQLSRKKITRKNKGKNKRKRDLPQSSVVSSELSSQSLTPLHICSWNRHLPSDLQENSHTVGSGPVGHTKIDE